MADGSKHLAHFIVTHDNKEVHYVRQTFSIVTTTINAVWGPGNVERNLQRNYEEYLTAQKLKRLKEITCTMTNAFYSIGCRSATFLDFSDICVGYIGFVRFMSYRINVDQTKLFKP